MKTLLSWIVALAVVTFAVIAVSVDAHAERRVALVVGNSTYAASNLSLSNPLNDAQDMTNALKDIGFDVITATNADKSKMDRALAQFARLASNADAALFFYAGHAMQFQGRNYLMPTDAELEDEVSLRYQMVGLEDVRAALDRTNGIKIMILDACRNNPLAARLQQSISGMSRAVPSTRGLAPIDKTQGMVVAFATAADDVAQDGTGRNSPFTSALLKRLQEPGLEIGILLRRVANDVNAQTNGRQRPETNITLLSEYYLNQNDRHAWERIKDQDDEATLREFLMKFPLSPLADNARRRLDRLEEERRVREENERKIAEAEARLAEEQRRLEALRQRQQQDEMKRQDFVRRQQEERQRQEALRRQAEEEKRQEVQRRQQEEEKRLEALRRKQEEEKRLEALRKQDEEEKRLEALRKQDEEEKRLEALRRQQEDERRLEALRRQQDEQKRLEALRKQEEEQKRLEALRKQEEEQKRLEALRRQEEEQKRLEALRRQEEEQKRLEALRRQEEEKRLAALRKQEEEKRLEALRKQEEEKRLAALRRQEEEKRLEALRRQEEEKRLEALRKQEDEKRLAALRKQEEEQRQKEAQQLALKQPDDGKYATQSVTTQEPSLQRPPVTMQLANLPDQIRRARDELRRLGCYNGASKGGPEGLDDATRDAVKTWWQRTNKPIVEVNITDEFIADLKKQDAPVCAPPKTQQPQHDTRPTPQRHRDNEGSSRSAHSRPPEVRPAPRPNTPSAPSRGPGPSHSSPIGVGF